MNVIRPNSEPWSTVHSSVICDDEHCSACAWLERRGYRLRRTRETVDSVAQADEIYRTLNPPPTLVTTEGTEIHRVTFEEGDVVTIALSEHRIAARRRVTRAVLNPDGTQTVHMEAA